MNFERLTVGEPLHQRSVTARSGRNLSYPAGLVDLCQDVQRTVSKCLDITRNRITEIRALTVPLVFPDEEKANCLGQKAILCLSYIIRGLNTSGATVFCRWWNSNIFFFGPASRPLGSLLMKTNSKIVNFSTLCWKRTGTDQLRWTRSVGRI